jgi:hypothetical protein
LRVQSVNDVEGAVSDGRRKPLIDDNTAKASVEV